jgi:hypothetical protein
LLEVPGAQLVGRAPSFGCFGVFGDVVDDETLTSGVGEGFANDDVDLEDGLAVEAAAAVASAWASRSA